MSASLRKPLEEVAPSARSEQTRRLVEPLTDRELEVLGFLPSRLTNAQIADQLCVSVNTVKHHTKSIYRKLGADGRDGAVAAGRAGRLLA